jgi:hypothetical protein
LVEHICAALGKNIEHKIRRLGLSIDKIEKNTDYLPKIYEAIKNPVLINKINKRNILEINSVNQTKKATKESLI